MESKKERDNKNEYDQDKNDDTKNLELSGGCADGSSTQLDDCITLVKKTVATENRPYNNS